ncbi:hypothetical protein ARMA_0956 [Ardenticatena maritima]|uniref:Uncharacterized protein n=1 Tax=Ardenticatena maritima TaxID=872965 RepID=A0A0M8K629_9CHLR|nr:hypothetical protein [Ardenticatena maritima]KPL88512.1 hypothetical protein SE16_06905 [Ardenticatena maritima]GAP62533.1 hypothetical protein ARMA_0956 [Ardenticatena maritima]
MTAQVHEKLIYEGEELSMAFCPPLPEDDPRIKQRTLEELQACDPIITSTACWRGYIATWEIKNGKFYLVDIEGRYKLTTDTPIFADWFSGVLRIPLGNMLHYVHMGFASVYEEELYIKIEKGVVVATKRVDNRGKETPPYPPDRWGDIF